MSCLADSAIAVARGGGARLDGPDSANGGGGLGDSGAIEGIGLTRVAVARAVEWVQRDADGRHDFSLRSVGVVLDPAFVEQVARVRRVLNPLPNASRA